MNITEGTIEDVQKTLAKHGMRMFEIVSYFLERKYQAIKEEHLLTKFKKEKTLPEILEDYIEEIEHYGVDRLVLSEQFLWERGDYYKDFQFDFPLGEITEEGEVVMSDLYACFSIEDDTVKLRLFDVP